MKIKLLMLLIAAVCLNSCSQARRESRRAAAYADKIESSEAVTAAEYSEMVSFYCGAMDRTLEELRPYHEAYSAAVNAADTAKIAAAERELIDRTDRAAERRKDVIRLGSGLFKAMGEMPDTTRRRLLDYLAGVGTRFSD